MDAKLKAKAMTDDQMENVAGGNRLETYGDGAILANLGLLSKDDSLDCAPVRNKIHELGYQYQDAGGLFSDNQYFNKDGKSVSRKEFWQGFAADHPELMKGKNINDLLK